jgi:hypothetical protein
MSAFKTKVSAKDGEKGKERRKKQKMKQKGCGKKPNCEAAVAVGLAGILRARRRSRAGVVIF